MAVMGIRINDGGSGGADTSVANVFAKALFGDPDREMKFARLQSDLATDEYQRRQIQANENYIRSQQALKDQQFQGNEAMVDPLAKLFTGFQASTQQPGPTEAPAPVELGPDPYAPIPADRPVVAEAPVPVELGPDPYIPVPADRPAPPPIELPPSANPMASTLSDLMTPDMPVPVLQTPDVMQDPTTLEDLLSPQAMAPRPPSIEMGDTSQFRAMPPDAVAPVTLETMNVTPGQEEEGPGDLPVPVDEPEFVDPNAGRAVRPAAPAPEEFIDPNVGREPRPEEVKAVADEVQKRTGTGLSFEDAQGIARGLIANGGDIGGNFNKLLGTAGLTYGDPNNAAKLRQSMALIGHTPNTTMVAGPTDDIGTGAAAAQKIAEETANPDIKKSTVEINGEIWKYEKDAEGKDILRKLPGPVAKPDIQSVAKGSTLVQVTPGADGGKATAAPVPGVPEPAPADPLAGSDNEQETIIRDVSLLARDPKAVISPKDATNYDLIYNKLSVPHIEMRQVDGKNGKETVGIEVPGRDLSMYQKPQDIFRRAGVVPPTATAPAPVSPEVSAQQVTQPAADPAAAPPAPTVQDTANVQAPSTQPIDPQNIVPTAGPPVGTQGDGSVLGTSGYKIIVPGPGKDRTEFQDRAWLWLQEAAAADQALKKHTAPPWYRQWAASRGSGSSADVGFFDAMIKHYGTDNTTRQFMALASTFINSEGRINSGAAIQNYENVALGYRFIDQDGDDEETRALKADQRQIAMGGIYDALANNNLMTPAMAASLKAMGYDRNAPSRQSSPNIVDYDPNVHGGGNL